MIEISHITTIWVGFGGLAAAAKLAVKDVAEHILARDKARNKVV